MGFDSALDSFENGNLPSSYVEDLRRDTTVIENFDSASYTSEGEIYTHTVTIDGPSSYEADGNKAIAINNREEEVAKFSACINQSDNAKQT